MEELGLTDMHAGGRRVQQSQSAQSSHVLSGMLSKLASGQIIKKVSTDIKGLRSADCSL